MLTLLRTTALRTVNRASIGARALLTRPYSDDASNTTSPGFTMPGFQPRLRGIMPQLYTPNSPISTPAAARIAGRSLAVNNDNPAQVYRRLHAILARDRIRQQLKMRERYEKPTQRRQREKKESAMRIFQLMVARKVRIVKQMKNR
jgi:ribosomal protein S21